LAEIRACNAIADAAQMGKLLSDIADADGDAGTIMRLIDAFSARMVTEAVTAERERFMKIVVSMYGKEEMLTAIHALADHRQST